MAGYAGDIHLGDTIDIKFCTVQTSGAPFTLAGSPVISAYVGNSTTEITAGITLTVDFDSRTGLNNVRVVASGGNGFAAATNISLVITTGTVNGVSVVGYEVGSFSIDCRGMNQILGTAVSTPATAGILDVNLKNANNVAATSITTINANLGTTQPINFTGTGASALVKGDAIDLAGQAITAAAGVTFPSSVASPTNITAGTITTATNVTTVNGLAANVITATSINAAALNGKGDWNTTTPPTVAAIATAVWQDTTAGDFTVASSIGKSLFTSGNAPGAASGLSLVGSAMTLGAGAIDAASLSTAGKNAIATSLLDLADSIETGLTVRGSFRLALAGIAGTASGLATTTAVYNAAVTASKPRLTATVDADGNRSVVTTDVT